MKHLYDDEDRWTAEATALNRELQRAIEPLFEKWADRGYSVHDITALAVDVVSFIEAKVAVSRGSKVRQKEAKR